MFYSLKHNKNVIGQVELKESVDFLSLIIYLILVEYL